MEYWDKCVLIKNWGDPFFIFNSLIIHGGSVNDDAMVIYGASGIYLGLHHGLWFSVMVRIVFVVYRISSPSCRVDLIVGKKGLLLRCDPCTCCGKLEFLVCCKVCWPSSPEVFIHISVNNRI